MIWPFRRKASLPYLGADCCWKAGELAECICPPESWVISTKENPDAGDILRVSEVRVGVVSCLKTSRIDTLRFVGKDQLKAWDARAFRKVVITHEPAEAEFTALIKRPVRQPMETEKAS